MAKRSPIIGLDDGDEYEEIEYEEIDAPGDTSGCLWGVVGGLGCLLIPLIAIAIVVILGINTLDGVVDGVVGIFDPPPQTYATLNEVLVLERVQALSELTTTRFNYAQLLTTERELPSVLRPLYGEQITMNAVGHINAGINLMRLTTGDIEVGDGVLTVHLPPPELLDCILNAQETRVVDSSTGFFAADSNIEEETRKLALHRIRDVALEQNILTDANGYASDAVTELLTLLVSASTPEGASPLAVNVITTPPDLATVEFPETCR